MALILALPAISLILISGFQKRAEDMEEAREELYQLTEGIASEQKNLVAGAQQLLSALAQLPEVRKHDHAEAQAVLTRILKINPQYVNLTITDRTGKVCASAVPMKSVVYLSDRRYFKNALATGQFSSGEYVVSRITGRPMLNFGLPFKNDRGEIDGVIGVNLNPEGLRRVLERMHLPDGSSYMIIDHDGVILSRGINPAELVGTRIKPAMLREMQQGPDRGSYTGIAMDGVARFSYYRKLYLDGEGAPYLYVRGGIPVREVLAHANKTLLVNLAFFAPCMILAFALAWFFGKRFITDRISALQAASQGLAAGDLRVRVGHLVKGGELGELAGAFDAMALALDQDSKARRVAEEALRESERFLHAINDAAPDSVSLHDLDGTLLMMNRSGMEMIQGNSGRTVPVYSLLPLVAPEYQHGFAVFTGTVLGGKKAYFEYELTNLDGRRLWLETHAVPFRNKDGEITSLLAVTRDITRRKQAETKVAKLNQELAAHAAELEAVNKELETFSYTVSHDLRSPLTQISLYCQMLTELPIYSYDVELQSYLGEIFLGTQRMGELISSLLYLSRISHHEVMWEVVDLSTNAKAIAAELQLSQPERRVNFRIQEGISVYGDEVLLRNVLSNLLENAWKYTGNEERAEIEVGKAEIGSQQVFYFVRDNGAGFDMTKVEQLFGPFQSLHDRGDYPGNGIGLATVQRIISRHGGTIWAEGEPGKGAKFCFTLGAQT